MKKLLTTTLAISLAIGFAFANSTKPVTPSKSTPTTSSSLATPEAVARENQQLREKVKAMESTIAELQGQFGYEQTMGKMMQRLQSNNQKEVLDEANASLAYTNTMNKVLNVLEANKNENLLAELQAQNAYQKTMAATFAFLQAGVAK